MLCLSSALSGAGRRAKGSGLEHLKGVHCLACPLLFIEDHSKRAKESESEHLKSVDLVYLEHGEGGLSRKSTLWGQRETARLHAKLSLMNAHEEVKYKHKDCKPRKVQGHSQATGSIVSTILSLVPPSLVMYLIEPTVHPSTLVLLSYDLPKPPPLR